RASQKNHLFFWGSIFIMSLKLEPHLAMPGICLLVMTLFVFSRPADAQTVPAGTETASRLASTNLQEITVTATRTSRKISDVPESVSVVDTEQIRTRQAADIGDILRYLPNVDLGGGPRNLGLNPVIRGMGDDRILFLLDGARQDFNRGHN